ncbi:MAG: NfeD family protein [Neisseriaceae bacterium]
MSSFYFFLIFGTILIILEIVTTTFYLLVIGIAFILASLFALAFDNWLSITILAGIFSIIGTLMIKHYKHRRQGKMLIEHVGQAVEVVEITKNNIRVLYSGSYWNAHLKTFTNRKLHVGDKLIITKFSHNNLEIDFIG